MRMFKKNVNKSYIRKLVLFSDDFDFVLLCFLLFDIILKKNMGKRNFRHTITCD